MHAPRREGSSRPGWGRQGDVPQRVNGAQLLVGVGAIALLVSLFLDWFKPGLTAWTVFELEDLLLAAIGIAALVGVVATVAPASGLRPPRPATQPLLALAALVLVAATLLNHPPAATGRELDSGAWIALGGSLAMVVGAVLTIASVSLTITLTPRERRAAADSGAAGPLAAEEPLPAEEGSYEEPEAGHVEPFAAEEPAAEEPLAEEPLEEELPAADVGPPTTALPSEGPTTAQPALEDERA